MRTTASRHTKNAAAGAETISAAEQERRRQYVKAITAIPEKDRKAVRLGAAIDEVAEQISDCRAPGLVEAFRWVCADEASRCVEPRKLRPGEKMPPEVGAIVCEKFAEIRNTLRERGAKTRYVPPGWVHYQVTREIDRRNMALAPEDRFPVPSIGWVRGELEHVSAPPLRGTQLAAEHEHGFRPNVPAEMVSEEVKIERRRRMQATAERMERMLREQTERAILASVEAAKGSEPVSLEEALRLVDEF